MEEEEPEITRQENRMTTSLSTSDSSSIKMIQHRSEQIFLIDLAESDEDEIPPRASTTDQFTPRLKHTESPGLTKKELFPEYSTPSTATKYNVGRRNQLSGTPTKNEDLKRSSELISSAIPAKCQKINEVSSAMLTNHEFREYPPSTWKGYDVNEKIVETLSRASVDEITLESPVMSIVEGEAVNRLTQENENMKSCDKSMNKREDSCPRAEQEGEIHKLRALTRKQRSAENAVMNLNAAKLETATNEFNLEDIYATRKFNFPWRNIDTLGNANSYNLRDVVSPKDKRFKRLFEMICWVFSIPMHCGYFNEQERNFVFKLLTLGKEKQFFLMEFLMRKQNNWFIARKYFNGKIGDYLNEMTEENFFDNDYHDESGMFFNGVGTTTLKQLCKMVKLTATASKQKMIKALQEVFRVRMTDDKSTARWEILKNHLNIYVGPIKKLSPTLLSLIHRILTLYYPTHNPKAHLSEIFSKLIEVHNVTKKPSNERLLSPLSQFPLFKNRQSLIDYVTAKIVWKDLMPIVNEENKSSLHWEDLEAYRKHALEQLKNLIAEKNVQSKNGNASNLPVYIQRFSAIYILSRVLILTSEVSKIKANEALDFLMENRKDIPIKPAELYETLIRIEMKLKNFQRAVTLTLDAAALELPRVDFAEIMDIVRKLSANDKSISPETKQSLQELLKYPEENFVPHSRHEVILRRVEDGKKKLWQLDAGNDERRFVRIEEVALNHYTQFGFNDSIQCAELLPLTILACLFWDEIYNEQSVPELFVSGFQRAPLDLFDSTFFENRRKVFTLKCSILEHGWDCNKICAIMAKNYDDDSSVESISSHCFGDGERFKEIIKCLGKKPIIEICRKIMLEGYNNQGFPQLFVWKKEIGEGRLVVLKKPHQNLSPHQKHWIMALERMNVNVDVSSVKFKRKSRSLTNVDNSCEG